MVLKIPIILTEGSRVHWTINNSEYGLLLGVERTFICSSMFLEDEYALSNGLD